MSRRRRRSVSFAIAFLGIFLLLAQPVSAEYPQIVTLAQDVQVSFGPNANLQALAVCVTLPVTAVVTYVTFNLDAQGNLAGATARAFIFSVGSGTPAGNNCTKGSTIVNSTAQDISPLPVIGSCPSAGCSSVLEPFLFTAQQVNASQNILVGISFVTNPHSGTLEVFGQTTVTTAQSLVCFGGVSGCGAGTVNFALCNFVDNCIGYALYGNPVDTGPPNANTICVTCQPITSPTPLDFTPPVTAQSVTPVFSTPTIDSRPFIVIALLFFVVTLGPYLVLSASKRKRNDLAKLYEIRI